MKRSMKSGRKNTKKEIVMVAWDEKNRPVGYILGVTPGLSRVQKS